MRQPLTLRELATRKNSTVLAVTVGAAALFGLALWYFSDALVRIVQGPEPVTLQQLSGMGTEAAGRWFDATIEVRPGHLLQTTTRRRRGGTTVTNHFALIRGKAVIVETTQAELPTRFLAWSSEFDETSAYYQRAKSQLDQWAGGPGRMPLSPLLLRTSGSVEFTRWSTGSAIAIGALGLIFMFWRIGRAMLDFTRTAPIARLSKSLRASAGVPALVAEIDQQLARLDPTMRRTGPLLLPSWMLSVTRNSFSLMSSSDVIWVAPYTVTRKLYSLIPLSKKQQVHIISRTGQSIALEVQQDKMQDVLTTLCRWAPWAVVGPDPAMETRFGKAKTWGWFTRWFSSAPSRDQLIEGVDKRREQILAAWAAHAASGSHAQRHDG